MSTWGRNDQAVTANSTTTVVTSNGAPIWSYALVKGGGGPNAAFGNTSGTQAAVAVNMFNNATPGAFVSGIGTGIFGVSATEQSNNTLNASKEVGAHAGWNLRVSGTGPIVAIAANATLTGYVNSDVISVKTPSADGANARITFTTNSTGGSLTFTIANPGSGFDLVTIPTSNISITNATGGTATGNTTTTNLVVTAGGRAGRVQYETLIAMGSLGAQTAAYGTPAAVDDAASDDTYLPGV